MYTTASPNTQDLCCLSLLWYFSVRNTVDRLIQTTLITSSVLIWAFLMFNHFNKNVISRRKRKRKHIFLWICVWFEELDYHDSKKPTMRKLFNKQILKFEVYTRWSSWFLVVAIAVYHYFSRLIHRAWWRSGMGNKYLKGRCCVIKFWFVNGIYFGKVSYN